MRKKRKYRLLYTAHRKGKPGPKGRTQELIVDEVKSVPCTPCSHPFVERLTGNIRREFLDYTLFWNVVDLERKLALFKAYYNHSRTHASPDGNTAAEICGDRVARPAPLNSYAYAKHCGGLFQLPAAA